MMERLSINEIIDHCKRTTARFENLNGVKELENADISLNFVKEYWEHKQVKDYLEELNGYRDLEEQGLLLRLPCKVGDKVYVKMASYCDIPYVEAEVRDFTHFTSCGFCVVVTSNHFDKQNIPFSEFGKTVFITQKEAEQILKEMESDKNV